MSSYSQVSVERIDVEAFKDTWNQVNLTDWFFHLYWPFTWKSGSMHMYCILIIYGLLNLITSRIWKFGNLLKHIVLVSFRFDTCKNQNKKISSSVPLNISIFRAYTSTIEYKWVHISTTYPAVFAVYCMVYLWNI